MKYRVEELDQDTWLIQEGEGPSGVYMYLLQGRESAVLIDAGYGTIPLSRICRELTDKPLRLILTHGHVDHIGGTAAFDTVYLHDGDRETCKLHGDDSFRRIFTSESLPKVKEEMLAVREGDVFDLGGRTLEILEAPGHSPGCICILDREHRWLFTGDVCCKAHVLLHMDYSTTVEEYRDSVHRLLAREAEYDITWPGHHEKPVDKSILREFETAAEGILDGTLEGRLSDMGGVRARLLEYGNIGIVYRSESGSLDVHRDEQEI